jgi:hypothetical protein
MEKRERIRKMAIACFLGGAIGTVVGLLVVPVLAWLGTLAGAAAAYIAYDVREFLRAIPKAFQKSHARFCKKMEPVVVWGRKKHPFVYSALIAGYAATVYARQPIMDHFFQQSEMQVPSVVESIVVACFFILVLAILFCLSFVAIAAVTSLGIGLHHSSEYPDDIHTYGDFLKCFLTGSILTPFFVLGWLLVQAATFCCYSFWVGLANFFKWLFMMIHCAERVCCAVYGGTSATALIVYGFLFMPNRTPWDIAFLAVCGGLLGAFAGATIGRRLVSFVEPFLLAEHQKVKS